MNTIHYHRKILNINPSNTNYINILCLKVMSSIVLGYMKNDLKKILANMYVVVFLVNFKMEYKWTRSTRNVVLGVYIHL